MTGTEKLADVARKLREGQPATEVSVRDFLSWFRAQRRGYWIVSSIRQALAETGIATDPDFEAAYIDSTIRLTLLAGSNGLEAASPPPEAPTLPISDTTVSPAYADPTYRISKLAASNTAPISVPPDASLQMAVTLMISNNFSQLPVMTSPREVKGVVSWTSIGTSLSIGRKGTTVRELMDPHHELRAEASLFQAIPIVVEHEYVLIRGRDNLITGIVTASDLSLQFQQLAEPYLLLGEIENHIRRILGSRFTSAELATAKDPQDTARVVETVADLTFGEYHRLLETPHLWEKACLGIDRATFVNKLDKVRLVRNDVMHFDPDPIPAQDLDLLRTFAAFLQRLQSIGVT